MLNDQLLYKATFLESSQAFGLQSFKLQASGADVDVITVELLAKFIQG